MAWTRCAVCDATPRGRVDPRYMYVDVYMYIHICIKA